MKTLKHTVLALLAVSAMGGLALAQEAKKEVGKGEGQVNIVAWAGYIESGATDKAFDWVTEFENGDQLQGKCENRRHLGRNGGPHERGRL